MPRYLPHKYTLIIIKYIYRIGIIILLFNTTGVANDLHTPEICIYIVYSHVNARSKWTNFQVKPKKWQINVILIFFFFYSQIIML